MADEINTVKSMLRSVLISSKEGVPANILLRDYEDVVGESLPFKKLGYNTLEDFILSIPDVVRVDRRGQSFVFHAVADATTAHIKDLVSKQRSKRKLKRPVRRPRGGGTSSISTRPRGPQQGGASKPRPSGPKSRPGMPSFIPPQFRNSVPLMTVQVGHPGTRTVHVGRTELLNKAMHDMQKQKSSSSERPAKKYDVPPRFRRKFADRTVIEDSPPPTQSIEVREGQIYLDRLLDYMGETSESPTFQTTRAFRGFVSSVTVDKGTYGSEAIFKTKLEAELAAARNAVLNIEANKQQEKVLPEVDWNNTGRGEGQSIEAGQISVVRSRVQEILKNKRNGLWSTRIPFEYKEKYKEDPPENLIELLKSWADIARFELVPNSNRDIVFPVNNENMNLVIPRDLLVNKDEEVTVYISFIYHPGYFCVQREDSPIDDITDQLQTHCKSQVSVNPSLLKKGQFCAGMFSGDGSWTRAEILRIPDKDFVELLFVDYGNVERVKVSDIRWLSAELAQTPAQAIICSLYGMESLPEETEWSSKSTLLFAKHVEETALIAIPRHFYDGLVDVELLLKSDRSVNIGKLLCDAGVIHDVSEEGIISTGNESMEPEALVLPEEREWDVHVTYISSSTNSVMLRLVGDQFSDQLDGFQAKLEKAFRSMDSENEITEGGIYVAYDDELYHRVRVMEVEKNKVLCYFLDHGDTDHLLAQQLEPLDPQVNRLLPYQAIEVRLSGLEEVSTNITALEKLCDMTLGKTCVAEVLDREDIPSLVLYDTSTDIEININDTILRAIEKEGGGIDSPRVASPAPLRVISPAPGSTSSTRISPAVSGSSISTSCDKVNTKSNISPSVDIKQNSSTVVQTSSSLERIGDNQITLGGEMLTIGQPIVKTEQKFSSLTDMHCDETALINELKSLSMPPESELAEVTMLQPPFYDLPSVGSYLDVHVPFVFDPHNFVCIPYDEMNRLNKLLTDMSKYFTPLPSPMNPANIQTGCIYAGLHGNIWARVKVQDFVGTDLVSVYLVDIGEYSVMMLSELQPLPEQFAMIPMMALACKLGRIQPKSGSWFEAAKYKFIELARGKDLVALIRGQEDGVNIIDLSLIDTSNENVDVCIDEVLVKKGFADLC